jgi:hypothetical protein
VQHDDPFATYGVQPNDPDTPNDGWLRMLSSRVTSGTATIDSAICNTAAPQWRTGKKINQALLGRQAEQVTIVRHAPSVAPAGEPIPIEISFRLEAPTDQNLRRFVQPQRAEYLAGAVDTAPMTTTTYSAPSCREVLTENAGPFVPDNTPGEYA